MRLPLTIFMTLRLGDGIYATPPISEACDNHANDTKTIRIGRRPEEEPCILADFAEWKAILIHFYKHFYS